MESSQSLSIESFSHSWSVNPEGSFRGSDEASFIEMDPTLPPSQRFFVSVSLPPDFTNFDFPVTESPLALVHADELISNGFLVPLFAQPIKSDSFDRSFVFASSNQKDQFRSSDEIRCAPLKRCRRLSRRIFRKYLDVIRPICLKLRRFGFSYGRRTDERKKSEFSGIVTTSGAHSTSGAYSVENLRRSCDSESSIHEAVMHCKRTIVGDK